MFQKIDSVTGKGTTLDVDASVLKNMFTNTGSPFGQAYLNTSGIQIKDHTLFIAQPFAEIFMDSIHQVSLSHGVTYANGVAGVATAANTTSKYLLASNGFEYRQILSKFFMGTFLMHEIRDNYLSSASIGNSIDNSTIVPGQGTAMEHNWDLAFGTFGVPVDFPATLTGLKYLGNYSNQVNPGISSNTIIMDAFLKGRAAISNKDMATKDAQVLIITNKLEELLAAAAIHELNGAKSSTTISDGAARSHLVSEAMGFVLALKFSGNKISQSQADAILAHFGTNLYDISLNNINDIINDISTIYNLDAVKGTL
jgi:hypothetical protein